MTDPNPTSRPATRLGAGVLATLLCVSLAGAVVIAPRAAGGSPAAAPGDALPEVSLRVDAGQATAARRVDGARPVRSRTLPLARRAGEAPGSWSVRGWRTDGYAQVGATWRGPRDPRLQARTRDGDGSWGSWSSLHVMGDGPTATSGERRAGLRSVDLWWAGPSRDLQVRVRGRGYRDLEVVLIDPGLAPGDSSPAARPAAWAPSSAAARGTSARARRKPRRAPRPALYSRRVWGAEESWRRGRPAYTPTLQQVHVHHTVNSNDYGRRDVAPMLRGIYRYHVKSLGWSDIGYNFLVDRFGRAWVGRAGGPNRRVRGAHTLGFNENGTGVAVIGNFEQAGAPRPARWKVAVLAAWKLDKEGLSPGARARVWSHGSDRYRRFSRPRLPRVAGHRDTNETACPGRYLYDRVPGIRRAAQLRAVNFS